MFQWLDFNQIQRMLAQFTMKLDKHYVIQWLCVFVTVANYWPVSNRITLVTHFFKMFCYIMGMDGCQLGWTQLRVRAFSHKTVFVYHVYSNFKLGYMCRITLTFGTRKDGNLFINIFASNNCFSYRNIFQNGVNALPKTDDALLTNRI